MNEDKELAFGAVQARKLIERVLPTDPDFDAFCLDCFPRIKRRFAGSMDRLAKENLLLEIAGAQNVLENLQSYRPDEFKEEIQRLIQTGEIEIPRGSPWPPISPEAQKYLNQLKEKYTSDGFPFHEGWGQSPEDDKEYEIFSELVAQDIFEPFVHNTWQLTYYGVHLLLDAIPTTDKAVEFVTRKAWEYREAKFPSYQAWNFEIEEELEPVANELRARGILELFTMTSWRFTEYGKDLLMRLVHTARNTRDESKK